MKKSYRKKDFDYILYDEQSNLLCSYKYKYVKLKFLIDFSTETANVLEIKSDLPISRNFSFRLKDKMINKLSKNDIKLDINSYLYQINNLNKDIKNINKKINDLIL